MRPPTLLLSLVLTWFMPPLSLQGQALPGQAPSRAGLTRDIGAGVSKGGSLDWFRGEASVDVGFTYRRTVLRRKAPGLDLGVSLFPQALALKVLFVAADAGLVQGAPSATPSCCSRAVPAPSSGWATSSG